MPRSPLRQQPASLLAAPAGTTPAPLTKHPAARRPACCLPLVRLSVRLPVCLSSFCEAMIKIRAEIADIESGRLPRDDNPLVNAPHPASVVLAEQWTKPYSRETAAFPASWVKQAKFWPTTARVDNVYGDRHLVTRLPAGDAEPLAATA